MKKTAAKKTAAKKKVIRVSRADELEKQINNIKNILDLEWNGSITCVQAIERITEECMAGHKIIKIDGEKWYRCVKVGSTRSKDGKFIIYTDCHEGYVLQYKWWQDDEWCDVCDLSELKIWEYNHLVSELEKYYPEYPIEYLEGRFV